MLRDLIVNSIVRFSLQNNKYIVGFVKEIDESSTKKYPVLVSKKNKSENIMISQELQVILGFQKSRKVKI